MGLSLIEADRRHQSSVFVASAIKSTQVMQRIHLVLCWSFLMFLTNGEKTFTDSRRKFIGDAEHVQLLVTPQASTDREDMAYWWI